MPPPSLPKALFTVSLTFCQKLLVQMIVVTVRYLRVLVLAAILSCVQCSSEPTQYPCELSSDRATLTGNLQADAIADQRIWTSYWASDSTDAGTAIDSIDQKHKADLMVKELGDGCEISNLESTFTDPVRPPHCRVSKKDICAATSVPPITVSDAKRQELAQLLTDCEHQGSWWTAEHLTSANQVDRVIQQLRFDDHVTWSYISGTCKDVLKTCFLLKEKDCTPEARDRESAQPCATVWDWIRREI